MALLVAFYAGGALWIFLGLGPGPLIALVAVVVILFFNPRKHHEQQPREEDAKAQRHTGRSGQSPRDRR
jgi:predicted PurR-regulated permease PerM